MPVVVQPSGANLFASKALVYVNATNADGIMGAGIALRFARMFPGYYTDYLRKYAAGELQVGRLHIYKTTLQAYNPQFIVSLHTMALPGEPADKDAIEAGLKELALFTSPGLSTAIPALGCGIGRFKFETLRLMVEDINKTHAADATWELYRPM